MTVKTILSHKGNDVVTIKPTATLCDAAEILNEHGVGAVVITGAERQVLGILSFHPNDLQAETAGQVKENSRSRRRKAVPFAPRKTK